MPQKTWSWRRGPHARIAMCALFVSACAAEVRDDTAPGRSAAAVLGDESARLRRVVDAIADGTPAEALTGVDAEVFHVHHEVLLPQLSDGAREILSAVAEELTDLGIPAREWPERIHEAPLARTRGYRLAAMEYEDAFLRYVGADGLSTAAGQEGEVAGAAAGLSLGWGAVVEGAIAVGQLVWEFCSADDLQLTRWFCSKTEKEQIGTKWVKFFGDYTEIPVYRYTCVEWKCEVTCVDGPSTNACEEGAVSTTPPPPGTAG